MRQFVCMIVGTLEIHLRLDGCFSLKDKRQVLRSLMDKARRDFQVSIAEVADNDLWNVATIGVACIGNDATHVESILSKALDHFDANPAIEIEQAIKQLDRK